MVHNVVDELLRSWDMMNSRVSRRPGDPGYPKPDKDVPARSPM